MTEHVIRYVVTKINEDGIRVMSGARQGRHTYATQEEAQSWLDAALKNNSADTIARFLPDAEVRPCRCYPGHFDPMQYSFD